jgi:hypothetical protein
VTTLANHVNGAYSVDDDGAGSALDAFTYTGTPNGTCTLGECHGGVSVNWNMTVPPSITCDVCHATTANSKAGVVDVLNYSWDGVTQSKINDQPTSGEFVTVGHGLAANGGKACADCHDSTVGHDTSAGLSGRVNPFRLKDLVAGGSAGFTCSDDVTGCAVASSATDLAGSPTADQDPQRAGAAGADAALRPKYDAGAGAGASPACVNLPRPAR